MEADALLAEDMAQFYADPLGFVMYAYPWDSDPSLQLVDLPNTYKERYACKYGPDLWACEFLDALGAEVRARGFDGRHAVDAIRAATASGHGIGKSALTAWLVDWIMSTRPHAKGVVTANTAPQLQSKTWAELAKWTSKCITGHWFSITSGRGAMRMYHKQAPESWFVVGQTCDEHNSEAFAGLHAAASTPFYLFDEASAIPQSIWQVAEGGLTDGEPMFLAFGNPTQNAGAFHACFHAHRHRWITRQIDSRSVQITNKGQIEQWIADYGIDSDFVKVRVRGVFPAMSSRQFISVEDVDAALGRHLEHNSYAYAPKVVTVDPAWEGDDPMIIGMRQGLLFKVLRKIPKNDNDIQVANIVARIEDDERADAVFVDAGYGTGIVSAGRALGRDWQLVWFGGKSEDAGCLNKRAEMWQATKRWLKEGGSIPGEDQELYQELIGPETVGRADGLIQLEAKKDLKARGQPSPNKADALALSFAYPVVARDRREPWEKPKVKTHREYDPMKQWESAA